MNERSALLAADVTTGYDTRAVVKAVTVNVAIGEIVALVGHNGAGKSTLLKCLFGLLPLQGGTIYVSAQPITRSDPRDAIDKGIAYVPQGARVFGDLTVAENLKIAATRLDSKQSDAGRRYVGTLFPLLESRHAQRAATLSGGEKQQLALAMALVRRPRVLLLDEPSMGLSPTGVRFTMAEIRRLNEQELVSILVVEQKVRDVLAISHRAYVLRSGAVTFEGPARQLMDDAALLRQVFL